MGRKPVNKTRIDNKEQKEAWVRTLLPIYVNNGLKRFTMDDIAGHLEISKTTLYKHFRSREEILELALEVKLADIGSFKEDLFDEEQPFMDRYFNAMRTFFREISGISTEFLGELKHTYPHIWKKVDFFREYAANLLKIFYHHGIEQGFFHDINPLVLVINDKLFFQTISDPDFLKENKLSMQDAFHDYFKLRCYGLFVQSPQELDLEKRIAWFVDELQQGN